MAHGLRCYPAMAAVQRCEWAAGGSPEMVAYHDAEWGVPSRDDRHLFEMLTLEGAQAGLSWSTILRKRDGYRRLFRAFEAAAVGSSFGPAQAGIHSPKAERSKTKSERCMRQAVAPARRSARDKLRPLAPAF